MISHVLGKLGYTVIEARDGTEALAVAQEQRAEIDLLITDVVMPGMRGWELAKKLSELRPRIKVLYISGYTDAAILIRILSEMRQHSSRSHSPPPLSRKGTKNFLNLASSHEWLIRSRI